MLTHSAPSTADHAHGDGCPLCSVLARQGRVACWACGRSISSGRPPTDQEREYAEREHAPQETVSISLKDSQDAVDRRVLSWIEENYKPLTDFTHDEAAIALGYFSSAVKEALLRLKKAGRIAIAGTLVMRRKRLRPVWQLVPANSAVPPSTDRPRKDLAGLSTIYHTADGVPHIRIESPRAVKCLPANAVVLDGEAE